MASSNEIMATRAATGQFVERNLFPDSPVDVRSTTFVSISERAVHLMTYASLSSSSQSL